MKKIILLTIIFGFLSNSTAFAYLTKGKIEELKKKELLIVTELSEKTIKKYSGSEEELQVFKEAYAQEMELFKLAISKYWKLNDKITYVSLSEAKAKMKANKGKYATMFFQRLKQEQRTSIGGFNIANYTSWYDYVRIAITFKFSSFKIEDMYTTLPPGKITEGSYAAAIRYWNNYYESWLDGSIYKIGSEEDVKRMNTTTLLLNKDFLHKKLTEEQVKEIYPYPIELVDKSVIDDAILNEKDYLYIFKAPVIGMKESMKAHYVIDAKTGMYIKYGSSNAGTTIDKGVINLYKKLATPKKKK